MPTSPRRLTLRCAMLVVAGAGLLLVPVALRRKVFSDFTKIPLSRCDSLRDVCEPIRMDESTVLGDGGSQELVFTDARAVTRVVCLMNDWLEDGSLRINSLSGKPMPIGGVEEKAFIGLLQRWVLQDQEAQAWWKKMERRTRSDKTPLMTGKETPQQVTKAMAVQMMKQLLERN